MRPVREITATEENFHTELRSGFKVIKRDPVEPEPAGIIVLAAFRIAGYDQDCDGSLMARLEGIDKDGKTTGWETDRIGLYPDTNLVVTVEEWKGLFMSTAERAVAEGRIAEERNQMDAEENYQRTCKHPWHTDIGRITPCPGCGAR